MASYTLQDIRDAADRDFAGVDIDFGSGDVLHLQNPMRLSNAEIDELQSLGSDVKADDDEQGEASVDDSIESIRKMIRLVAKEKHLAERLIGMMDRVELISLIRTYMDEVKLGEASASQN